MPRIITRTYNQAMLDIVKKYLETGGNEPLDLDKLARFAIAEGYWEKHPRKLLQDCKRDFARAFREQYHEDAQRRQVRTYHAAKSEQQVFWADMRSASPEHMEIAFSQRRGQIVGDCRQLKNDVDSYNDNNTDGAHIQMVFDFRDDLAELEQPTKYPPAHPR